MSHEDLDPWCQAGVARRPCRPSHGGKGSQSQTSASRDTGETSVFLGQGLDKDTPERAGVRSDKVAECRACLLFEAFLGVLKL